jgi:DNA (cytosine-5)-methyltransferase 1
LAEFDVRERWLAGENAVSVCACGSTNGAFNVSRLSDGSLQIILAEFERIGYNCHWRVLNAADYGVPQLRERLFIIGSRDNERIQWPRPTHSAKALKGSQSPLFAGDASSVTASWRTMWDCLWHKGHPVFGSLDPEVARLWVKNVVRPHDEPVTWTLDRPSPTVGAHQAAKLAIAPFGVPEEQLLRQQWHTLGRRQGDMPPVSVVHEYLSDEELLRLQTFPPQWYLFGTRMERARQIGNAVPVLLARAVGSALLGAKHGATDIDDELTGAFHDG